MVVKVSDFRDRIAGLERLCQYDHGACVGARELELWLLRARRVGAEVSAMVCKRANAADMARRERAIDRSAALIVRTLETLAVEREMVRGTYQTALDAIQKIVDDLPSARLTVNAVGLPCIVISVGGEASVVIQDMAAPCWQRCAFRVIVRWSDSTLLTPAALAAAEALTSAAQLASRIESYLRGVEVIR